MNLGGLKTLILGVWRVLLKDNYIKNAKKNLQFCTVRPPKEKLSPSSLILIVSR